MYSNCLANYDSTCQVPHAPADVNLANMKQLLCHLTGAVCGMTKLCSEEMEVPKSGNIFSR